MATRLNYAFTIWRRLISDSSTRLREGSLASRVEQGGEPLVIVTGPGRSGTSAVARVLHESGVSMGREFLEASDMNAGGFYEEAPVRNLNDRIIFECGLERLQKWPWRSTLLAVAEHYGDEMAALAKDALGGWKDPQFTTTLEAWLPHLGRHPKIVVCLRSADAYVESVVRVSGMQSVALLRKRWAQQYRRLLDVIRAYELDATSVEYDELVQEPETTAATLSEFVGRELDAQYIDASLRQFRQPVLPNEAGLYGLVLALSGRPRRESLVPRIDVDEYLEQVAAIEQRVLAAKDVWTEAVRMPGPEIKLAETRAANEAYGAALRQAQFELGAIAAPRAFARYHELTRRAVDLERHLTQLLLEACPANGAAEDGATLEQAIKVWRRHCSPEAIAQGERARSRELARARRASD